MGVPAILKRFARQKKGAIAVLTALTIPVFIAGLAFAVDFSVWCLQSTRLQSAADAAALGAGYLLEDSSLELQSSSTQQADFLSSAQVELDGASNNEHMIGTLSKPITVTWSWTSQSATVTLASQANLYFAGALGLRAPTLHATATASLMQANDCLVALDPTASAAININNGAKLTANHCSVFANSTSSSAISVVGGSSVTATSIGTEGGGTVNNGGSVSPTIATHQSAPAGENPYASNPAPTPPSGCTMNGGSFTSYQSTPYQFQPFVSCGTVTIGGNGSSDQFAPGVYYIENGSLIFTNANITLASGVTFVLTGSSPGSFQWTNGSGNPSMSAPTSGPTAGVLVWQTCPSSGAAISGLTFNGGSQFQVAGALYTPCGKDSFSNGTVTGGTSGGMSIVADQIQLAGGSNLSLGSSSSSGGYQLRLTQ